MHDETIAIHAGYEADGTRAVAVPIYMTVANDFIDAEHANSIMDLAIPGFHYNRINNPTNDVLEKRIAALEGGTAALVVASGMAAVSYAILTVATAGSNFVVAPQLYGATYTYFAHVLSTLGIEARFAADDQAASIERLIDDNTRSGRRSFHRRQYGGHTHDVETVPPRRGRSSSLAHKIHRRPRNDARRRDRRWRHVSMV
jgi:O-acetylhomoserine (thiol)-lyase